jgi:hypothetical protein
MHSLQVFFQNGPGGIKDIIKIGFRNDRGHPIAENGEVLDTFVLVGTACGGIISHHQVYKKGIIGIRCPRKSHMV